MVKANNNNKTPSNKKYILVAEDDKFYGKIFKRKFSKEGYDVEVASDGEKTLEKMRDKKPDLLLLDLVMPVKDGFEVLEEMQANDQLKGIKVIVISNLGQEGDVEKAKKLGASDYFIKSNVSIKEVVEIVKKNL